MDTFLITLGGLLLVGLAMHELGRRTRLPRVTLLLVFGFLAGPAALDVLAPMTADWFPLVAHMALALVGFLLGEKLVAKTLREHRGRIVWLSIVVSFSTAFVVALGLLLLGATVSEALLLGAIAMATAPAASMDVVHEVRADGPFSRALLGIVALDDAWGLIVFSIVLTLAQALEGGSVSGAPLLEGARELFGSVVLGAALGIPMSYLTGRIQPGEPTLAEALGLVFLCAGLALWLELSFLLTSMVMGAVVANFARHHTRPFHEIENIEWPFMIVFFVLAGASLEIGALRAVGWLMLGYLLLRAIGRVIGGWLGASLVRADGITRRWMGLALLPQAGVALGMALVAVERFPTAGIVLPLVIGSTVVFEILGPVFTRRALERAGEVPG